MNKQQLATKYRSPNKMRSKIEANEYKDYILGFIFYKFLSDRLVRFMTEGATEDDIIQLTEEDEASVKYVQGRIGAHKAYKDLLRPGCP